MGCAASDIVEGANDIYQGATGQEDAKSYNLIRDGLLGGNEIAYTAVELISSLGASGLASNAGKMTTSKLANYSKPIASTPVTTANKNFNWDGTRKVNIQLFANRKSPRTDFYVKANGEVIPSTGYRYMNSKYADQTMKTKSAPGSYFGFEKFDSAAQARDAYQVSPLWSDCKLRGKFDNLQVIDDIYVPKLFGDKGVGLEPITKCYPENGSGGRYQLIVKEQLKFDIVEEIGD